MEVGKRDKRNQRQNLLPLEVYKMLNVEAEYHEQAERISNVATIRLEYKDGA